ncbi:MAG TPA: SDR family NAD(P)-dependent oxidoreductase [Dehalococcoidia bacterium]|nr:SDR family NAD(P)-dependent oxidoreductase [Dehalococcoidia bacterium]
MFFEGKTVAVTGAGGFIGSHVVERLLTEGARVRAMLRYTSRGQRGCLEHLDAEALAGIALTHGDVRDFDAVREFLRGADVVFHLAALIGIPYSYEHPQEVIDTNIIGTTNVLLAARELGTLGRVVLTSTSEVYGSALRIPMDEEHPLQAQSPYSATKIAADALGLSFHRSFGLPVAIARPFNAYGPRQSARAVIPAIVTQALAGGPLRLGTLDTTRDFTFVEDTARGFLAVAASDAALGEVVNLGSGTEVSIRDVVANVGAIVGRELTVEGDEQRMRPAKSEVSRLHSDSSKALRLAGWRAEVPLDQGLRRTTEWIEQHMDLYRPREYAV